MKRFLSILLVALLIMAMLPVGVFAANGSAKITINESKNVTAGQEVTLTVKITGDFAGYKLYMKADSGLTITAINGGKGHTINMGKNNVVVWASENNYIGEGHTFTVTVKVADDAAPGEYKVYTEVKSASMVIPVEEDTEDGIVDGLVDVKMTNGYATLTVVCDHVWGEWKQTKAPDCNNVGKEERACSKCGATETRDVDKTQHSWSDWTVTEQPTCAKEGVETRTCSICGEKETRKVDKLQHAWGEWTQTKAPTCKEEGVETRTCSACGETETRKVDKLAHAWGEWTVTEQPTCTKEGTETRTCSACGETETRKVAKVDHKWSDWTVTKAATCTEDGLKERVCSVCGEKQTEVIPSSEGHAWGEWTVTKEATCTEAGEQKRTCSACGEVETAVIEALGHAWSDGWMYDETHHWHVCGICGEKCEHNGEHTWGEWTVTKDATRTEEGEKTRSCSICSAEQTESTPATGDPTDPPKTGDPSTMLMVGGISILLLLLAAALYYIKRKASSVK